MRFGLGIASGRACEIASLETPVPALKKKLGRVTGCFSRLVSPAVLFIRRGIFRSLSEVFGRTGVGTGRLAQITAASIRRISLLNVTLSNVGPIRSSRTKFSLGFFLGRFLFRFLFFWTDHQTISRHT